MNTSKSGPNGAPRTCLRALVVEDDPAIRDVLADVLVERGHEVVACPDGEAAWAACQREAFGLILLDLGLPGMDGLELCRRLRTLPHGHQSVVVVLTARFGANHLGGARGRGRRLSRQAV